MHVLVEPLLLRGKTGAIPCHFSMRDRLFFWRRKLCSCEGYRSGRFAGALAGKEGEAAHPVTSSQ
jgi:hypothetical protein